MLKKIEIFLRKIITRVFLFLMRAKPSSDLKPLNADSRVVLISLNRIGDALVSTPLLKILKESAGCHITMLVSRNNHFVFQNNPHCDEIIKYEKGLKGLSAIIKRLNKESYNYIIDLHDDVSTTVTLIIGLCRIKYKCGLRKSNEKVYTHAIERPDSSKSHIVDRMMKLAELFNLPYNKDSVNIVYKCSDGSLLNAEKVIQENSTNNFVVGINISAGSDARFWGTERYKTLCDFLSRYSISIVIITAQKDLRHAEGISDGKYKIFCSPSFDEFAAIISKLDFLFTPDTAAIHLASAFEIPVFGLYARYGTNDMIWSSYRSKFEYSLIEARNFAELTFGEVIFKFKPFFDHVIASKFSNSPHR